MTRLDASLWKPSALGLVGPPGAITAVRTGNGFTTYYAPLYDWMGTPAAIPDALRARCNILIGTTEVLDGLRTVLSGPAAAPVKIAAGSPSVDLYGCALQATSGDAAVQAAAVVLDTHDGSNLVTVLYHWVSPAISWSAKPEDAFGRIAMAAALAEHLVAAGFVGILAPVPDPKVRQALAPVLDSVRTLEDAIDEMGIGT